MCERETVGSYVDKGFSVPPRTCEHSPTVQAHNWSWHELSVRTTWEGIRVWSQPSVRIKTTPLWHSGFCRSPKIPSTAKEVTHQGTQRLPEPGAVEWEPASAKLTVSDNRYSYLLKPVPFYPFHPRTLNPKILPTRGQRASTQLSGTHTCLCDPTIALKSTKLGYIAA